MAKRKEDMKFSKLEIGQKFEFVDIERARGPWIKTRKRNYIHAERKTEATVSSTKMEVTAL